MAATLLELKSRLVVPPPEVEVDGSAERDDEIIDPRAGLVRQLLTYRRFKEATQLLPVLELEHEQRHERRFHEIIPEDTEEIDGLDLTNCDVGLLYDNFETILVRINRLEPRTVLNDDVPLEHKINGMIDIMRSSRESTLKKFFALENTVSGRVGVVMATLECARQRFIEAKQFEQFGEVILRYREDQERTIDAGELPPEPVEDGKKRRKRIPLVTWHPPERSNEPEQQEIDLPDLEEEEKEVVIESDEQKFLRELEETCAVDAVLTRIVDLDAGFIAFQAEQQAAAEAAAKAAEVAAAAALIAAQTPVAVVESPVALETSAPAQSANEPISKRPKRRRSPPAPKERQNERKNVQFHGTISNDDTDDDFFEDSPLDAATNDENPPETPPTDAS